MLNRALARILAWRVYSVVREPSRAEFRESHPDLDDDFLGLYERRAAVSATSAERVYALDGATGYICDRDIPGDLVDVGVWKREAPC